MDWNVMHVDTNPLFSQSLKDRGPASFYLGTALIE